MKLLFVILGACLITATGYAQQPKKITPVKTQTLKKLPANLKKDTTKKVVTTIKAPVNPPLILPRRERLRVSTNRIYPEWIRGDRDFFGHGPEVRLKVTLVLSAGGAQLEAFIQMSATERGGDGTEARIYEKRTLAYAPRGRRFTRILTNSISSANYIDNNWELDYINPVSAGGPVRRFIVKGDTDGPDVGNNTEDDCFLQIDYNEIEVETLELEKDVREIAVPLSLIAGEVRNNFSGTVGHINNFGPCRSGSCFLERNSYVKFPDNLLRDTIWFPINEIYKDARHYYFNDINLQNLVCGFSNNYLNATLQFESNGAELVGKCANDLGSFDAGCAIGTPSAQLNNLSVQLGLRLIIKNGKLTYEAKDIQPSVRSDFSVDCGILDWLCGALFKDSYETSIYRVAVNLRRTMAAAGFVNQVANGLTPKVLIAINRLNSLSREPVSPATTLVDVSMDSRNVLIRYR